MSENYLKVGQKVKLDQEKRFNWTVRAVREQYAILTSTLFGKGYYTIADLKEGIRGPDDHQNPPIKRWVFSY